MARRPPFSAAASGMLRPMRSRTGLPAGATSTSRLPAMSARLPRATKPAFWISSIQSSSAEANRSAGAPALICRASAEEAAKDRNGRAWPCRAQASAAAFIDSCRLAAASTSGPRLSCAAAQDGDSKSDSSASARSRSGIGEKKRMTVLCVRRRGHAIVGTCFCRRARSAKQALVTPILPPFVRSGRTRAAL